MKWLRSNLWRPAASILVLAAIFLAGNMPPVRLRLLAILKPILGVSESLGRVFGGIMGALTGIPHRLDEEARLREEAASLRAEVAYMDALGRENDELRAALGRIREAKLDAVEARVVARSVSGASDYLLLDAGVQDGISVGMPVLLRGEILVGHIFEAGEHTASAKLISDTGEKTEVHMPKNGLTSVAQGNGLGVFSINIPSSILVERDESIFSAGAHPFLLGFVTEIEKSPSGPFQTVRSNIPFNLYDIARVYIVRTP